MRQYETHTAMRDVTTGLWNRQAVRAKIEQFLLEDFGTGQHAMLILDIDNFRSLNESMGRVFGDTVIQMIADGILSCIQEEDVAGRVGGDEFLIFLKNRTKEEIVETAMCLTQLFYEIYTGDESDVSVTGSTGISLYPKDGKRFEELFRKADEAMYVMKSRGKNWYHFYTDSDEEEFHPSTRKGRYRFEAVNRFPDIDDYNRELVRFAFDALAYTKIMSGGMNIVLDRIGRQYGLDRIRIMRVDYENRAFEGLYMWQDRIVVLPSEPEIYGHFASAEDLRRSFGDTGIIQLERVEQAELFPDVYEGCVEMGITACICCGIYNAADEMLAYVGFELRSGTRKWTKEERDTFCFVTKLITHFLLVNQNSRQSSRQIERLSNFDKVTGLYLYNNFKAEASRIISAAGPGKLAIINSDIRNFKYINDTYGLEVGDRILRAFAEKAIINNRFCMAGCRVYADNFMALVRVSSEEMLAEHIVQTNAEFEQEQRMKYPSSDFTIYTGAYIIQDQTDLVKILDGAGLAKKSVKEKRGLKYAFFDDTMRDRVLMEGRILAEVKAAILEKKLVPFLQPKFSLETKEVIGAEALVRWRVNDKEYYYPNDFIPVLERSGNVVDVDFCIYHQVLDQLRKWLRDGKRAVPVSVNISRVDCRYPDFEQLLIRLADQYGVPHSMIEFEITESAFFENAGMLMEKLDILRHAGFGVSIDDFGSGYSSLSLISRMPIDVIKMDQSFLRSGLDSERSACVLETMIHMAKKMNLGIICEGVETQEHIDFLLQCGCHMGQGYVFAKPMPMEEFEARYLP